MLERYARGRIAVFELLKWYRTRLAANAVVGLPEGWWAYSRYADGTSIPREHRRTYHARPDLRERFPDASPATDGSG